MSTNTQKETTAKINPFDKYKAKGEKKAYIKSLDYEITYRKLTAAEDDEFNIRLLKDVKNGDKALNVKEGSEIRYEKIAMQLVDPKVTIKQLKSMDADVTDVMNEILSVIEKNDSLDEEGNLKS